MPWKPSVEGEIPTLGWVAIDWMVDNLAQPARGWYEPFRPTREQEDFILRWYSLDPETGKFPYRRALLGRPRGWGKSPCLAGLAAFEALGDCLFDGWDAEGQPVGRPWSTARTPLVQIAAVSEDQTRNTWQPLLEMLGDEAPALDNYPGLEPMLGAVMLPKRGRIEQVTSSANTQKGAPAVFAVLDQALALDTPIPTPEGWTTMGELSAGDTVFGSAGPTSVLVAKPPSLDHECFRVEFSDGTSVIASEGHLWLTRVRGSAARPKVRTTGEMLRDGRTFRIPVAPPQERPEQALACPPYLLGYWLGDGTRGKAELAVSEQDLEALTSTLARFGISSHPRRYRRADGASAVVNLSFTVARGFQCADRPEYCKALQGMDVYRDKSAPIPREYLLGSIAQRTELLQGLMDSDGCVTSQGTCTFVSVTRELAELVTTLLRSLGQVTTGPKWVIDERYSGGGKFRVDFTPRGGFNPFLTPRKRQRVRDHRRGADWITVTAITAVPRVPVRCIGVESDDHLFAFGLGGHLTHNTEEWTRSNGGIRLAHTLRTNVTKNGGRTIESPNAYIPGEGSVAEQSAEYAKAAAEGRTRTTGILWDHREAPPETDLSDRDSLIVGLRHVYGDSSKHPDGCVLHDPPCPPGWVDLDPIVEQIWDPATDPQMARSDFLNQITHSSDSWIPQPEWEAAGLDAQLDEGDTITLGFDGSRGRNRGKADATALIACRVADGLLSVVGVWEQPEGPLGADWLPDVDDVSAAVNAAFQRWNVVGFYADPSGWTEPVARWEAQWGRRLRVKASQTAPISAWPRGKDSRVTEYVERLRQAIAAGEAHHDHSPALTRHVLNARRRQTRTGYLLYKEFPDSHRKIDAAYAAVLAWKARIDAIGAGVGRAPSADRGRRTRHRKLVHR